MNGRESEIFRDCYNLLKENDISNFVENSKRITSKYTDIDDKMLCTELLSVVGRHMSNTRIGQ